MEESKKRLCKGEETKMGITLQDFIEMAISDDYICYIWDNEKEEQVFYGELADIPDELLEQEFSSWEIDNGRIGFNIN